MAGNRFYSVDFLRGLCILAVILLHINIRIPFSKSSLAAFLPDSISGVLFWSGHYGVKIFFVISGFLITSSILIRWGALRNIDCKTFYRLRFARIAPCLLALLVVLSALHLAGVAGFTNDTGRATLPRAILAALTFHLNWLEIQVGYLPAAWDILWSLSVEETFYLLYPLICRFITSRFVLFGIVALLVAAGPFFRTVLAQNEIASDYAYLSNMDGIAFGCLAAVLATSAGLNPRNRTLARAFGWVLFLLVVVFRRFSQRLGLTATGLDVTVLEIGVALVVLGVKQPPGIANPVTAAFRWFGRNSYEVYLTHSFVVIFGTQLFHYTKSSINTAPLWFTVMIAASGVLGHLVARYYSEPANHKLRSRRAS